MYYYIHNGLIQTLKTLNMATHVLITHQIKSSYSVQTVLMFSEAKPRQIRHHDKKIKDSHNHFIF